LILPAPVLHVPGVFSPAFCGELIAHFEASPHQVGGMASVDAQGLAIHKIDAAKKHRHDFVLGPRDPYLGGVLNGLIRAVLPDIKKAFHIDACHTDRFIIARYDDSGGYFRRHRDNSTPNVAFRQFVLSVTLNTGAGISSFPSTIPIATSPEVGQGWYRGGASRWLASTAKRA
jgi:hypothetical protein